MKQSIIKTFILLFMAGGVFGTIAAQSVRSSYFLENSLFRHQLNPAFMGETNYFSIPALGNPNLNLQGNIGLSNFIYKYNDPEGKKKSTTFMNEIVDRNKFLNKLNENNKVGANINLSILSGGFHKWDGFNTIDLSLRSHTNMNMPYELFNFMKTGMDKEEGSQYRIENLKAKSINYLDLSFGHSRKLDENLTIGGKFKILLGIMNTNAQFDEMDISLSEDMWLINSRGSLDVSMNGTSFKTDDEPNELDEYEITGADVKFQGFTGFGLGLDFGATYKMDEFVEGLTLSASLIDFGFISWGNSLKGKTSKDSFLFEGFEEIGVNGNDDESGNKPLEDQFDDLLDDLEGMIKFYDHGKGGRRTSMLSTTIHIGAEYILPQYKNLSFGFLSSTHINRPYTWTEGRFYANITPKKWFGASINYAASTFGHSLGWMLNFTPKGFNFFIASDHMITKVNSWFIPVNNANASVSLGFNITFGDSKRVN